MLLGLRGSMQESCVSVSHVMDESPQSKDSSRRDPVELQQLLLLISELNKNCESNSYASLSATFASQQINAMALSA